MVATLKHVKFVKFASHDKFRVNRLSLFLQRPLSCNNLNALKCVIGENNNFLLFLPQIQFWVVNFIFIFSMNCQLCSIL